MCHLRHLMAMYLTHRHTSAGQMSVWPHPLVVAPSSTEFWCSTRYLVQIGHCLLGVQHHCCLLLTAWPTNTVGQTGPNRKQHSNSPACCCSQHHRVLVLHSHTLGAEGQQGKALLNGITVAQQGNIVLISANRMHRVDMNAHKPAPDCCLQAVPAGESGCCC